MVALPRWLSQRQLITWFHLALIQRSWPPQYFDLSRIWLLFRFVGSLQISSVQESDEGRYECMAENDFGVVFSHPASLYVRGMIEIFLFSVSWIQINNTVALGYITLGYSGWNFDRIYQMKFSIPIVQINRSSLRYGMNFAVCRDPIYPSSTVVGTKNANRQHWWTGCIVMWIHGVISQKRTAKPP